jgi:gliding motility-associated lipoprotein GldD
VVNFVFSILIIKIIRIVENRTAINVTMKQCSLFSLFILFFALISCQNNYVPKPQGYYRIDFPPKEYRSLDTNFPYTFMYPSYAKILPDPSKLSEPYWINILYVPYHAQLHISYKPIKNNLKSLLEDSHTLVNKHIPKANSINQREYIDKNEKVYGLVYDIKGLEAASVCQFYLTDSVANFVRGALYFNLAPNNDSLAPVIDFLKQDIEKMISTFQWKKVAKKSSAN